jgi:peptidyl-prolyl cis-trans isomerase B (cyclophilin B)
MARSQDPNSASSQFFICHADSDFLDGEYAAFGVVTSGLDVVDKVCETAEPTDGNGSIATEAQPVINSIKIRTK